jgi:hypothetical protein
LSPHHHTGVATLQVKMWHGFQGWHQDKVPGISNTIVVNLGGSDDGNDDKEEDKNDPTADGPKSFVKNETALG